MFKELNILKIFFEDPYREFNVREAARVLKITPATASTKLKEFSKLKILKFRKLKNLDLYKANIEQEDYRDLKIYYNILKIRFSGLIEAFNEFYLKPTIILYGSSAHGYDVKESDFDFVIISEKSKNFPKIAEFEKKLRKNLQIFSVKNLKELKNSHLINNVLGGILLQGEVKWI